MAKTSTPRRRRFQVQVSIDGSIPKLYDDLAAFPPSARRKRLLRLAELYLELVPLLGLRTPDLAEAAAAPAAQTAKGPRAEKKQESTGGGKGGVSDHVKNRLRGALSGSQPE